MEYLFSSPGFDPSIDEELSAPPGDGHGAHGAAMGVDDVKECSAGAVWLGE